MSQVKNTFSQSNKNLGSKKFILFLKYLLCPCLLLYLDLEKKISRYSLQRIFLTLIQGIVKIKPVIDHKQPQYIHPNPCTYTNIHVLSCSQTHTKHLRGHFWETVMRNQEKKKHLDFPFFYPIHVCLQMCTQHIHTLV